MNLKEYGSSQANMSYAISRFTTDKWLFSIIPEKVRLTLDLLLDFIDVSKAAIFRDGKILELSIWNIIRWWSFVKVAHQFVKDVINVWK